MSEIKIVGEAKYPRNGDSAYQTALNHGFVGTEEQWLESLRGYTPQKHIDYYTEQDQQEMKTDVELMLQPQINRIEEIAEHAEVIARGRATGYVFDTLEDLEAWLNDSENVAKLILGDNLYIRAVNTPDYWWDGTSKQILETEKPDLTGLATEDYVDTAIASANEIAVSSIEPTKNELLWLQKIPVKNLIKKLYYGEFFNTNTKQVSTSTQYARTDYIEIKQNTNYIFSHELGTANGSIELFDKDFNFIERIVNDKITTTFSVTNPNGKYIMICPWNQSAVTASNDSWAQLEEGTVKTTYEAYKNYKLHVKNDEGVYEEVVC